MLKINEFRTNHRPSVVKMLAKFIRHGIRVEKIGSLGVKIYTGAPPEQQSSQP